MLDILIVEDEPLLATTLKHLIELNPRYRVTAIADDLPSAMEAVAKQRPDLALVDLQLANATSGFSVAAKLHEISIPCLFTTGKAPGFPVPDLAMGCLRKPFHEEDLVQTLRAAEDIVRGRDKLILRPRLPDRLQLYSAEAARTETVQDSWVPVRGRERDGIRTRVSHWFAAHLGAGRRERQTSPSIPF